MDTWKVKNSSAVMCWNINVLVTPSLYTKNENFEEANIVVSSLGEYEKPFEVIKGKTHGNELVNIDLLSKIINHWIFK